MTADNRTVHVGPLYGVRKWMLDVRNMRLRAVNQGTSWSPDWNRTNPGPLRDYDQWSGGWGAGFYSLKRPPRLMFLAASSYGTHVLVGVVELQGHVIEHSAGYRSEWARPVALGYRGRMRRKDQLRFAMWCQGHHIEYMGSCSSYSVFGKLSRIARQFRQGKKLRPFQPLSPRDRYPRDRFRGGYLS